jgi:hypothetical protein
MKKGKLITYRETGEKVEKMNKKAPKFPSGKPNISAYLRDLTEKDLKK